MSGAWRIVARRAAATRGAERRVHATGFATDVAANQHSTQSRCRARKDSPENGSHRAFADAVLSRTGRNWMDRFEHTDVERALPLSDNGRATTGEQQL